MYYYTPVGERDGVVSESDMHGLKFDFAKDAISLGHNEAVEAAATAIFKHLRCNVNDDAAVMKILKSALDGPISDALGDLCADKELLEQIEFDND